jgi:hypothetical protein
MVRIIAAVTLTICCVAASAQPGGYYCAAHSPTSQEIREVLELAFPQVPESAQLDSACIRISQRQTHGLSLVEVRSITYAFAWPTDTIIQGVRFHRTARCARVEQGSPGCGDFGQFVEWKGSRTTFTPDIASAELVTVLEATEDVLRMASAIQRVELTYRSDRGQRFAGIRRYRIVTVEPEGEYVYLLQQECASSSDCTWEATSQGRYIAPVP